LRARPNRSRSSGAPRSLTWCLAGGAAAALALTGCKSARAHAESADEEVYAILEARRLELEADLGSVDIDPPTDTLRLRIEAAGVQAEPITLDLVQALDVAAENSREYQTRKEVLYLTALDLTLERWRFKVQEVGTLGALVTGTGDEAQDATLDGNLRLTKVLGTGARIVGDIGFSMFRVLTTGDAFDFVSDLSLSVTQPLLAGFGERIVMEPLTQAERDVVYAVRAFERYRRTFVFDVTARYLRLLQAADAVENQRADYESLQELRRRNEAWGQAGRMSDVEVDQARQQEVQSRDQLIQAEQDYQSQLDDFKFLLGLQPDANVQITPDALDRLAQAEPQELPFDDADLLSEFALRWRLDHLTALDQLDDARRRSYVAADALRNRLDFAARADLASPEGEDDPLDLDLDDATWQASLQADLALDRMQERNSYRISLINLQGAQRDAEQSEDEIRLGVREALREADRTLQSWILQKGQVALNERRMESTRLQLEAGRVSTRDLLEATRDLLAAKNSATRALIDQYLAVQALWRDLEMLRLGPEGPYPDPEMFVLLQAPQP
jgi:outer membrane protein TolC